MFVSDGISRKSVFFRRYLTNECLFQMVSHKRVFVSDGIARKSVCFRWYLTEECLFQMVSHERVFVSDGISWKECLFQVVSHERMFVSDGISRKSIYYASPISGEAYRDRRLTTNFELWVEFFCVSTCFHMRIPKPCLSVRPSVCPSVCLFAPRERKSS